MKKSIGILAAVLLSASVYSQPDPAYQNRSESSNSTQFDSGATPAQSEFEAQSTLRSNSDDSRQGVTLNDSEAADVLRNSTDDGNQNSEAKQGLSLSDDEAAATLRQSDDPDRADLNHQEGLADPDAVASQSDRDLRSHEDSEPDMIYEEWILITPPDVGTGVGAPAESESGSSSSKSESNWDDNTSSDPQAIYDSQERSSGLLNDSRIYNGEEYSDDFVGAPAQSQSESDRSMKDDDLCMPGATLESDYDQDQDRDSYHANQPGAHDGYYQRNGQAPAQGSAAKSQSGSDSSSNVPDNSDADYDFHQGRGNNDASSSSSSTTDADSYDRTTPDHL